MQLEDIATTLDIAGISSLVILAWQHRHTARGLVLCTVEIW